MMNIASLSAVILCGGEGLRFKNDQFFGSKVMAPIAGKPLVWHILQHYRQFGVSNFILCTRDDDTDISSYFSQAPSRTQIKVIPTGNESSTGARLKAIEPEIATEHFFATYGDGLADINLLDLFSFHVSSGKMATLTAVRPFSQYGILNIDDAGNVSSFLEKPRMEEWINGGYFVFNKEIFNLLNDHDSLEEILTKKLVSAGQLKAFRHSGFWKSVDTFKDYLDLSTVISLTT
jgi:glucose-1-phosphate cytidylyltransferase